MGSFSGAEVCELIGAFILSSLSFIIDKSDMGIYRDDGLVLIRNPNGPKVDRFRKKITNALKMLGFNITTQSHLNSVNFLENLKEGTLEPYMKDNNTPIYINTLSNHPPSIIKHIPKSISRRLSENSSNIHMLNKNKIIYNNALKINGHKQPIEYTLTKCIMATKCLLEEDNNIVLFFLIY